MGVCQGHNASKLLISKLLKILDTSQICKKILHASKVKNI